jgi:hypothetical protein
MQYGLCNKSRGFITILHLEKNKIDPLQRVISWKAHEYQKCEYVIL